MSAGLAASTVTPGSTAPDVSFTTPVMDDCANSEPGTRTTHVSTAATRKRLRIPHLLFWLPGEMAASLPLRQIRKTPVINEERRCADENGVEPKLRISLPTSPCDGDLRLSPDRLGDDGIGPPIRRSAGSGGNSNAHRRPLDPALPYRPGQQTPHGEGEAGIDQESPTQRGDGGKCLADQAAQLAGMREPQPAAHLLAEAVVAVRFPSHDFGCRRVQRQL